MFIKDDDWFYSDLEQEWDAFLFLSQQSNDFEEELLCENY